MRLHLSLLPVLLLGACASQPASPPADAEAVACNADAAKALIGQRGDAATVEAARKAAGAASVRALKPTDAATMDYRHDRLNVLLDEAGSIARFSCG